MSARINGISNTNNDISIENNIIKLPLLTKGNINLFAGSTNNANLSSVNSNVVPDSDNSRTLGTIEKQWSNAYIRDLSSVNITISGNLNPFFNDTSHLGSITRRWNIAYIKDLSDVNNINDQPYIPYNPSYVNNIDLQNVTTNINPLNTNSISLGTSSRRWANAYIRDISLANISISGNIILNICGGTITNINKLTASASDSKITSSTRLYQEISGDISWNAVNGYYGLAKDAYPALNPLSSGVQAVQTWIPISSPESSWWAICWSGERGLFVAVAEGGDNRVMTSPDGINWTGRTSPNQSTNKWWGVCWSKERSLFVALSITGTNRAMTSPDGITWTERESANENNGWTSVCWSPQRSLFVAVSYTGTNRAMTSPDGITWTGRTSANEINNWINVCWSPESSLFVAVSFGGINRVMTSPDGITWTGRKSSNENNGWRGVCWSKELELFVAVAETGSNRVMTSPNGITWTGQKSSNEDNGWYGVCWSPELGLFVAVAQLGSSNKVMTSPDGITWAGRASTNETNRWRGVCWSKELGIFAAVATAGTNRVMTSSLKGRPPTSYNVFDSSFNRIDETGNWTFSSSTITTGNISDLSSVTIDVSVNCNPLTNNNGNLGGPIKLWGNAYIRDLSIGSIDISVNLNPLTTNTLSLGNPLKCWGNAYIRDLSISSIDVSVNCNPLNDNSGSLGGPTKRWGNAYINNLRASSIDISVNINPLIPDSGSLGLATRLWGNAYIRDISIGSIDISVNINPLNTNSISLGLITKRWGNAYINDLSISNIGISGNIILNICGGTITNINKLTAPASDSKITTTARLYQEISGDISWNAVNGYYGLAKDAYPALNPLSTGVKAVQTWTNRNITGSWSSITWSPKLGIFIAISTTLLNVSSQANYITSRDGITWTIGTFVTRTFVQNPPTVNVSWSPELEMFVSTSNTDTSNVMYSTDGTSWNYNTIANNFRTLCWSPELRIFLTAFHIPSTIYTSNNGITWNQVGVSFNPPQTNLNITTKSICWSSELGLFVGVGNFGDFRIINSKNGTLWNLINVGTDHAFSSVCWSKQLGLFVVVSSAYTFRVSISNNGTQWTHINIGTTYALETVAWSPQLGLFIAGCTSNTILTSSDGIKWSVNSSSGNFLSSCWSPELGIHVAVGANTIVTSSLKGRPPTSYNVFDSSFNSIDESGNWTFLNTTTTTIGFIRDLSSLNIDITNNLNPLIPNNGSIGGPRKLWGNAYIRDLSVSSIDISVNLNPLIPNNGSIGLNTKRWGNIHTVALFVNGVSVGSDDRIKHNEVIITNGLTIINQLTPKFYQKTLEILEAHYYGDLTGYRWSYESGLIAQELLQISDLSFVVSGGDYYDSNNVLIQKLYSVNYNSVFVYGLAAIKELHSKVKTQELIINSLLTRIEALENKL